MKLLIGSMMVKPNFFIIGAPKSATSALRQYLSEHPLIYIVNPEEPNFYSTDIVNQQNVRTEEEYLNKYFHGAKKSHVAVGEKSTWYLYSDNAVENIDNSYPDAKYIVMFRNPVELAYSLHSELLYTNQENIKDFLTAWRAQVDRKNGLRIPGTLRIDKKMLYYGDVCKLGKQTEKILSTISREKIMFILYDDFRNDTQTVYNSVLSFLGVPDDMRQTFNKVNQNKVIRSKYIDQLLTPNQSLVALAKKIKKTLGLKKLGVGDLLIKIKYRFNTKRVQRNQIPPETKSELIEFFREDIKLLGNIIDRDIDHWLK